MKIFRSEFLVSVEDLSFIRNKRVLVVDDGPTLTHGGMAFGAGTVAARQYGAAELVDPRPYAVGSLREVFERFPHLKQTLPAMGYGKQQVEELRQTIRAVPCDVIVVGTPFDLTRLLGEKRPTVRVKYELDSRTREFLKSELFARWNKWKAR